MHLMTEIQWPKHTAEAWLEQYGAWVNDLRQENTPQPINPIYLGMLRCGSAKIEKRQMALHSYNINDDEARAVMRILLDMMANTRYETSAKILILKYENGLSIRKIASLYNWSPTKVDKLFDRGLTYFDGRISQTSALS